MMLSIEHAKLRINYLKKELARLPRGRTVTVRSHGYKYDGIYITCSPQDPDILHKTLSINKKRGNKIHSQVMKADNIESTIHELSEMLGSISGKTRTVTENKRRDEYRRMGLEFFNHLKTLEDSNPYKKPDNAIEYKGILMRTKGEVIIAQHLDALNYPYVYESCITLGKKIYPDFSVYIPEIDKVIFIEFMGAFSDPEYLHKAGERFKLYSSYGIIIGRDSIFICETKTSPADLDLLDAQLNAAIMAATEYV